MHCLLPEIQPIQFVPSLLISFRFSLNLSRHKMTCAMDSESDLYLLVIWYDFVSPWIDLSRLWLFKYQVFYWLWELLDLSVSSAAYGSMIVSPVTSVDFSWNTLVFWCWWLKSFACSLSPETKEVGLGTWWISWLTVFSVLASHQVLFAVSVEGLPSLLRVGP